MFGGLVVSGSEILDQMSRQTIDDSARSAATALAPWLIPIVGIAVYANSLSGPFVYDDYLSIKENEHIRQLWPPERVLSAPPQSPVAGRPVICLTLAINYALGGLAVPGYHAINIAVHISCALVLFGVIRRTLRSDALRHRFGEAGDSLALVAVLIWLVHPLQTECVNYTTQRTESIMALFYLLTLYCAIRARVSDRRRVWAMLAVVACALGMGSKESMVTAPFMVLLYDRTFGFGSFRSAVRARWRLYAGLTATWLVLVALMWTGPRTESVGASGLVSSWGYLKTQAVALVHYVRLVFWPHPLVLDYGYPEPLSLAQAAPFGAIVLLLLVATLVALAYRPALGFVGAWFFVILSPTSSFIPIVSEVAAERRMYLPSAGVITLMVALGYLLMVRMARRRAARIGRSRSGRRSLAFQWCAAVTSIGLIALASWGTIRRNRDYQSELSIWQSSLQAAPGVYRAHSTYGALLESAGRIDEAIEHYREAIKLNPDFFDANVNMCVALGAKNQVDEALEYCQRALRAHPSDPAALHNTGIMLQMQGRHEEAIEHYREALGVGFDSAELRFLMGTALLSCGRADEAVAHLEAAVGQGADFADAQRAMGEAMLALHLWDAAVRHFNEALDSDPSSARAAYGLGMALSVSGRSAEAVEAFRTAARLRPRWPAPLRRAAWILATDPDAGMRDPVEAVRLAKTASELTGHRSAPVLDTLAAAYAAAGDFELAATTARRALESAGAGGNTELSGAIRERLAVYERGRAYVDRSLNEPSWDPQD